MVRGAKSYTCIAWLFIAPILLADSISQPSISIVIDDIGNSYPQGIRTAQLPGPVTLSVLPLSKYGQILAELAHNQGKEVMLHMPMDNDHNRPIGPAGLSADLDQARFVSQLEQAIGWVPHIQGLNNHMGSRLTQSHERMEWVMRSMQRYPLYFLDSRTSVKTVAERVAQDYAVPALRRDVFLDNNPQPAAINQQFLRLIRLARQNGSAIAIGHPYPTTLAYLELVLPKLNLLGIKLVSPSGILALREERDRQIDEQPLAELASVPGKRRCKLARELHVTRVTCG